ncbi:hypothetical protein WN943_009048 [Citrus x changshan-huyou]
MGKTCGATVEWYRATVAPNRWMSVDPINSSASNGWMQLWHGRWQAVLEDKPIIYWDKTITVGSQAAISAHKSSCGNRLIAVIMSDHAVGVDDERSATVQQWHRVTVAPSRWMQLDWWDPLTSNCIQRLGATVARCHCCT